MAADLLDIYHLLFTRYGPQHWWPGDSRLEIMVGAVLTQNTNWENVSRAIATLKREGLLSFNTLCNLPPEILADKIRSAGYYNLKATRLQNLLRAIAAHDGDLDSLFSAPTAELRQILLAIKGIGPETADSILLYAGQKPVFVVDAYTHRIFSRHNLICEEADYCEIQEFCTDSLPEDVKLFNEFHALLVRLGKEHCKKSSPRCTGCPLEGV